MLPIADGADNRRLMKGYLDTTSTSVTTVTVAGLASRLYDVYVYADGDNKPYDRSAAYTISGAGITTTTVNLTDPANTNFDAAFTRANDSTGNYVRFSITATGFTLTATPTAATTATRRAPVNGIQIVPAATPPAAPSTIGIKFIGTSTVLMSRLEPELREPIRIWTAPDPLELPVAAQTGTLILRGVDTLPPADQRRLLDWLHASRGLTQVVSTTTSRLLTRVNTGGFLDALYYCLNIVCVDLTT